MHTPTTPVSSIHATLGAKGEHQAAVMRNAYTANLEAGGGGSVSTMSTAVDGRGHMNEANTIDEVGSQTPQQPQQQQSSAAHPLTYAYASLRQATRTESQQNGNSDVDYESAVRASRYGRRQFPSYDPANMHECPIKFVRQFEHAAQHNGLSMKMWAKRLNSCLYGRAADWAFDECPLELAGFSWDTRKRQFLDWALLPAEQELRRQRLLRFIQTEADLSIDFVYSFEEAARGLRDHKEDVWVRKCIANLLPPLRSALFELWPEGLPVRFRDLRDSLYAVDWNLYEAASTPLRVVKHGTPYAYEAYSRQLPSTASSPRQHTGSRNSLSSSVNERPHTSRLTLPLGNGQGSSSIYSPPAPMPTILPTRKKRSALSTSVTFHGRNGVGMAASAPTSSSNGYLESPDGPSGKMSSETNHRASVGNPGASDLLSALSRIPEKERSTIIAALEKLAIVEDGAVAGDDMSVPVTPTRLNGVSSGYGGGFSPTAVNGTLSPGYNNKQGGARLASMSPPGGKQIALKQQPGTGISRSRAAAAAAVAASAHITSMDGMSHRFQHGRAATAGATDGMDGSEIGDISNATSPSLDGSSGSAAAGSSARTSGEVAVGGIAAAGAAEHHFSGADGGGMGSEESAAGIRALPTHSEPRTATAASGGSGRQGSSKIRLRTRPLTSIACCSRPQSSPAIDVYDSIHEEAADLQAIESAESTPRGRAARTADADATISRQQRQGRRLSSRKSDSALTTATRSMRAAERTARYRESVDNPMRSPEFTVVHPAIDLRPTHTRRTGRFAFIKKLSHMLTPHHHLGRERTATTATVHQVGA